MRGELLLGGLGAFLLLWFGLSAVYGLGQAFPFRPSVILPGRSRSAAFVLVWAIVLGIAGSAALGGASLAAYVPFVLVLALPIWDISASSLFKNALVILNAGDETGRPAIRKALEVFFGDMEETDDTMRSGSKEKEAFRIDTYTAKHMIILSPLFVLPPARMKVLEGLLQDNLRHAKASGANLGLFWIAVVLPAVIAAAFGFTGYILLTSPESIPLRPALGA